CFAQVHCIECDKIGHLFAFEVDNCEQLTLAKAKGRARLRFEPLHQCANGHALAAANGGVQEAGTLRPEYCRASELSPKSSSIGLFVPCHLRSRWRMVDRIRSHFPSARKRRNCLCALKTRVGKSNR